MPPQQTFTGEQVCSVELSNEFKDELGQLDQKEHDECVSRIGLLAQAGSRLQRPYSGKLDTNGSAMKDIDTRELRWETNRNPWRALYVLDRDTAVMLTVGCKSGFANEDKFYQGEFRRAAKALSLHKARTAAKNKK